MILVVLSNASLVIQPYEVDRSKWKMFRRGYTIKEMKAVIAKCDDKKKIEKIKCKILYRRLFPFFLLSTPILIIIAHIATR